MACDAVETRAEVYKSAIRPGALRFHAVRKD
jgi:hypothetical protein